MLNFSEFLLQILYIQLKNPIKKESFKVNTFFDTQKLLTTFKEYTKKWTSEDWKDFFINLLKYRLLFDYFVIRIPNDEDVQFDLEFSDSQDLEEDNSNEKKKLRQYQAMLYAGSASKSFYIWLNPCLKKLSELYKDKSKISCKILLNFLKNEDDKRNILPDVSELNYNKSPLYWFRRLDYYLWENNLEEEKNDELIESFRFRRGGRSIEHLYPQDSSEQSTKWEQNDVHRFGNLCLISSSFNSTQSNDSVTVKFARVKDQIERKHLESLKLYKMYKSANEKDKFWNLKTMEKHEKEMYAILKNSYAVSKE